MRVYSVKRNTTEIIINKSTFITNVFFVKTKEEIDSYLKQIKEKYSDATHNCYAYRLNGLAGSSDDGEPSGTAGKPILNVLEKNDLNYCLCIVTRYFGGIKLGAGGLVRAYTKATTECLKENIVNITKGYLVELTTTFKYTKKIENLIPNIKAKVFTDNAIYIFEIEKEYFEKIKNELYNISNIKIIEEIEVIYE